MCMHAIHLATVLECKAPDDGVTTCHNNHDTIVHYTHAACIRIPCLTANTNGAHVMYMANITGFNGAHDATAFYYPQTPLHCNLDPIRF